MKLSSTWRTQNDDLMQSGPASLLRNLVVVEELNGLRLMRSESDLNLKQSSKNDLMRLGSESDVKQSSRNDLMRSKMRV